MLPSEWVTFCALVRDQMSERVSPSVTPLSRSDDFHNGFAWATGTYVALPSGTTVLLTNEHVARRVQSEHLAHLPSQGANYELLKEFRVSSAPEDLAVSYVSIERLGSDRIVLSYNSLDASFAPLPNELLYWHGFPGTTALRHEPVTEGKTRYSWFGELQTVGLSMLSQQVPNWPDNLPAAYNPDYHVLVHYPAEAVRPADKQLSELPNPHGLSGSLLWDTKAVSCLHEGHKWDASKARVCGVIWATWDNPEVVVATKVEFLHRFLAAADTGIRL